MPKSAQRVSPPLPEQPPPGVERAVLMIRLWVVVVTVAFVLGLVSLDCDPYLALTGGVALIAAAIRLTRK